jgi:predicted peptidase
MQQQPRRFTTNSGLSLNYLLALPTGYCDDGARRWPLLLFLHGRGEKGGIWNC